LARSGPTFDFDEHRGQAVGSHIRMGGSAFGIGLAVDEVVTEHDPPRRKAWRTVAPVRLLIIGAYEMGFAIAAAEGGCDLKVRIDYSLPGGLIGWLASPFAALYADWCVRRMTGDARTFFAGVRSEAGSGILARQEGRSSRSA